MSKGNYVPVCKGMVMEIFYRNDTFSICETGWPAIAYQAVQIENRKQE